MKAVRFHAEAMAEIAHDTTCYSQINRALAERFVNAVENAVALAAEFSAIGATYRHGTRRCFPRKFPFSIVYVERNDEVFVLALAPFARKPGYWRERRKDA